MHLSLVNLATFLFCSLVSSAEPISSQQLKMTDYDQIKSKLDKKISESRRLAKNLGESPDPVEEQAAIEPLRDAMLLLLARPDTDNLVAKLMPDLRRELNNFDAFEEVFLSVGESLLRKSKDKGLRLEDRVTTSYQLQNLLTEIQSMNPKGREPLKSFVKKVIDQKIEVDKEVASYRNLNFMDQTPVFKKIAEKLLK